MNNDIRTISLFLVLAASLMACTASNAGNAWDYIVGNDEYQTKLSPRKYKLAYIGDDMLSARLAAENRVLAAATHGVKIATRSFSDGSDIIAALATEKPDIVITDLNMPVGGLEVCKKCKELGIPCVIITSSMPIENAVGVTRWLTKKQMQADLPGVVRQLLGI